MGGQSNIKSLNAEAIRASFPMLKSKMHGKNLLYFDSAATALTPQSVIEATQDYYAVHYGTIHRAVYALATENTARCDEVRKKVAHFIKAKSEEEIIFTKGGTESINLVAHCLGRSSLNVGDEVLISEIEHHANIIPWQLICNARGAELKVIPVDDRGDLILSEYENLLSYKTKVVAVGHISNAIGTCHPIKQVIDMAHDVGAQVLIDGAQGPPHLPVDMQALGVDYYTFTGHKLYGPTGIGVLYGKQELLADLPPYQGGGDMIDKVSFEETTYADPPQRFEAGTPNIAGILGLGAAIDYLNGLGMEAIYHHGQALLAEATEKLKGIEGLSIIGDAKEKGPIISFVIKGLHPLDIGSLLDLKGIAVRTGHHCAQTAMERFGVNGTVRLSFGLYNTSQEVDGFVEALKDVMRAL